jgi:hypothetical protein
VIGEKRAGRNDVKAGCASRVSVENGAELVRYHEGIGAFAVTLNSGMMPNG